MLRMWNVAHHVCHSLNQPPCSKGEAEWEATLPSLCNLQEACTSQSICSLVRTRTPGHTAEVAKNAVEVGPASSSSSWVALILL